MFLKNISYGKSYRNIQNNFWARKYFGDTAKTAAITQPQSQASSAYSVPQSDVKKINVAQVKVSTVGATINPPASATSTVVPKPPVIVADDGNTVPFDDIPGPTILRQVAKVWQYVPVLGTQITGSTMQYLLTADKLFGNQMNWLGGSWLFKKLLDKHGPVVRLQGPFGGSVVILSRPEHVSSLFQSEGAYPIRSCLDSVENYRLKYRQYRQAGPFLMHGPEWEKLRKCMEKSLQESIIQQNDKISKTCDEFVERILSIRNKQEEVPVTFHKEIYKWCMECLCSVALNKRLGFLDPCGLSPTSDPGRLLTGFFGATAAIRKIEYGPQFYKIFSTIAWRHLVKNCDMIDNVLSKYVQRAQEDLLSKNKNQEMKTSKQQVTLLESLLLKEGTLPEDVNTILLDMMLIGVNATAHTVSFLLYHLAKTPRCQIKLLEEIKSKSGKLTVEALNSMKYLKACIKESLRLNPPMPVLTRVLSKDVIIHSYRIPKGTYMLIATHLASLTEEHFEDAHKFKPERWLVPGGHYDNKEVEVFASIPFGYGSKGCMAKEMAEMQVGLLLVKILQRYRVEYHYGSVKSSFDKFLSPQKRPEKFRFINRV